MTRPYRLPSSALAAVESLQKLLRDLSAADARITLRAVSEMTLPQEDGVICLDANLLVEESASRSEAMLSVRFKLVYGYFYDWKVQDGDFQASGRPVGSDRESYMLFSNVRKGNFAFGDSVMRTNLLKCMFPKWEPGCHPCKPG